MICGGFDKKDINVGFDYKSCEMEKGMFVCVVCINESRVY